ncbi:UNVERIFIED_CONTAM: hypothetical protein FKN15_003564 [Acipenser sinensis]
MSDVVEKTLTALPSLLSLDSQPGTGKLSGTSKLGNLIRNIAELTSKHDEEKLIKKELAAIKEHVSSPNTTLRQMKEIMVRMIYCEMLGYEASFGYIHAIKLAQQGSLLEKRVGYLAVSLFLNESHELLLLLVNTVLKDLQSTNLIEVCMALTVASQIFPKDMIPAVLPLVEDKLQHSKEIIRRKAVLALYKFYLIAPNQVQHIHDKFRKALCDKDPDVMAASLHIYGQMIKVGSEIIRRKAVLALYKFYLIAPNQVQHIHDKFRKALCDKDPDVMAAALHIYGQMIKENPDCYKDLTESFVTILKQVVGGKLPVDFNYHSVPAPWLQIQLLRILALLGKDDQSTSELMYDVLDESVRRAEINHNMTYALNYEPYGLSLPVSLSSCSITGRQSPTGLSLSSGLSGNSTEMGPKGGSNSLKLEGVRNVWGKEGYLPQKETTAEGTLQVLPGHEGPSTEESAMENASLQPDLASPTIPEEDQEKQQLASSLFVGLGSHNTLCLVSESTSHGFPLLEGQNTANCQCSVLMEKPCAQGALVGSIAYQAEPEKSSELQFSIAFALADFIRPLTISTEEYGKLWLSFSNDVKQNLKLLSDAKDPLTATLNALKETLQLHIVDIIGTEGIVACQLLPAIPCLLHCRINTGMLAVWLRSPSPNLPDCLLYQCQKAIQKL